MFRRSNGSGQTLRIFLLGIYLLCCFPTLAHASFYIRQWQPFLTLGGGLALTSNIGTSATFSNPTLGGMLVYHANRGVAGAGAGDAFLGIELDLPPAYGFEVGLGYNQTSSFNVTGTGLQGAGTPGVISFGYRYKVVARQYLAEAKLLFNIEGTWHPYGLIGVGVSQNSSFGFRTNSISLLSAVIAQPQFTNRTTSSFSYIAGIGMDYDVLCGVRLGFGYRIANFGKVALGAPLLTAGASIAPGQSNFYVHELIAHLTFI